MAAIARARVSVPLAKASNSNTPTGPFQTMVPAGLQLRGQLRGGLRADVEDQVVGGDVARRLDGGRRVGGERLGARPRRPGSAPRRRAPSSPSITALRLVDQVGLGQRLADRQAGGQHEGVGDAAADDQLVDLVGQRSAGWSAWSRPWSRRRSPPAAASGCASALRERVDLGRQQRAGAGDWRELRDAVGRGLGAVRGAERVVHEDVAQRGHLAAPAPSSFFFSPLLTRQFSSSTTSPGCDVDAVDPVGTQRHRRGRAARPGAAATGASESSGLNSPSVGRPRCEVTITAAPASSAMLDAGHARRGCACLR